MSMFQGSRREHRRPLDLDWNKLLPSQDDDEPPPTLVVKSNLTTTRPFSSSVMDSDHRRSLVEQYRRCKDFELEEQIQKRKATIEEMAFRLPDKGEKLYFGLKLLEEEKERRQLRRIEMQAEGYDKPTNSSTDGALRNDNKQETIQSQSVPKSSFASYLSRKIDEKTGGSTVRAIDKEPSILGRSGHQETKYNGKLSPKRRHMGSSSSRQQSFKSSWGLCHHEEKNASLKGHHKGRASTNSLYHLKGALSRKDSPQVQHSMDSRPRKGPAVVDLDEDEPQCIEETEDIDECIKETTIYYPSRDDPEFVEICYEDIKCLGPESYLTSNIMNFYIRYLQQHTSPTNRAIHDYHFFNTYFYQKLQNAVSYKCRDKDEFFVKFRRWWKGVDIFQKAYILIPIHQE